MFTKIAGWRRPRPSRAARERGVRSPAGWSDWRLWQRRRSVVVKDSREFNEACERWTDALHRLLSDKLTPRTLKRFKNRVRFYTMMRGGRDGPPTPLADMSDADLVALGAMEQAGFVPPGIPEASELNPEELGRLPVDEALREEMIAAVSRIRRDDGGQRAFHAARHMVKRA